MSPRSSSSGRQGGRGTRKAGREPSVVGSTLGDAAGRLRGRGLPRGGIRERDGLKVAEGALPDSTIVAPSDGVGIVRRVLRVVAVVSGSLAALLVVFALVITVLSHTDLLAISSIQTFDSEHVSAEEVSRLADVGPRDTLLNVDVAAIEDKVRKNPWVSSVEVHRVFPDTLRIEVHERTLGSLVAMSSGGIAWLLGDDGVWIEPTKVESGQRESTNDVALAMAEERGVILICDVPPTVSPVAGSKATDDAIEAVMAFRSLLSPDFADEVASYSAASEDDISCILKSGVEVSLGSPTNVETKQSVAQRILAEYAGQVTYINVRIPSRPSYRRVNSAYVREGTGATGASIEEGSAYASGAQGGTQAADGEAEGSSEGEVDAVAEDATGREEGYSEVEGVAWQDSYADEDDSYDYDSKSYDPYAGY